MRVLVAGRNAKALAKAAGAFASDLGIETASTKAAALTLLGQGKFDLVLACERLDDGSGLEVLSHVAVNSPDTLRIFAARPSTLELLKGELGLFGLFRTLAYPINFRKLWAALDLARSCAGEAVPPARVAKPVQQIRHVVLDAAWEPTEPKVQVVALAVAKARAAAKPQAPVVAKPEAAVAKPQAAAPRAAAPAASPPAQPSPPARIPESETFKRALARRNEAKRRLEPSMSSESLAQLAKLATTGRPTYELRPSPGAKKRTALFVGSGVFAAGAAAVLTYFMVIAHDSVGAPALPLAASIDRPVPQSVLPWQPTPNEDPTPTQTTTLVPDEAVTPAAAADMEVEAEAASEATGWEPSQPPPPPPNPPPGPSEPPKYDASGMPIQE
jgi:DNA-binding response OmpR family regulator